MSSIHSVGKIFYMTGTSTIEAIQQQPWGSRGLSLNRTSWKSESYQGEIYSYLTEFSVRIIRTCRKNDLAGLPLSNQKTQDINTLNQKMTRGTPPSGSGEEFRTTWKPNSYLAEFFSPGIRTPRNFIRTVRKACSGIIDELPLLGRPINTFLFISKGEE